MYLWLAESFVHGQLTIFIISYINILFITKIAFWLFHMGGRVFKKKTPLETLKYYKSTNMCSFAISAKIL